MHQSLAKLPARVVIDTNVLLNACFVSDGVAAAAIAHLKSLGFSAMVDQAIEEEAISTLGRLRIKLSLDFDPATLLRQYLGHSLVLSLPKATPSKVTGVNRADRHVFFAADYYDAWILTGDVKFASQCQDERISVRLPWDVLMEAAMRKGIDPPLHYSFRFAGISPIQGTIFGRVVTGPWGGVKGAGQFTVCEVGNVARLAYDADTQDWVFTLADQHQVRAGCVVNEREHWVVCGSYRLDKGNGNATIRAFSNNKLSVHASKAVSAVSFGNGPTSASFGHTIDKTGHWNGWLRTLVISPRDMTGPTWNALKRIPESAPDPMAGNVLEAALQRVTIHQGLARIPTQQEISHAWI